MGFIEPPKTAVLVGSPVQVSNIIDKCRVRIILSFQWQNVFGGDLIYASVFQLIISKNGAKFVYYLVYNHDESE